MVSDKRIGEKYGKWTILSKILPNRRAKYLCRCDCGNEKIILLSNLTAGYSSQCMDCQAKSKSLKFIGNKYHFLTILDNPKIEGKTKILAQCDCGKIKTFRSIGKIIDGTYTACGECSLTKNNKFKVNSRVGKKFGRLLILKYLQNQKYECKCDCGNEIVLENYKLRNPVPSCGCYLKDKHIEYAKRIEGTRWGYFKIVKFLKMGGKDKRAIYLMKCKCGTKIERSISYIFGAKSCGCLHKENVPKGSAQYHAKITEVEAVSIRELFASKLYKRKELAEMFGLSYENTCSIIKKKSWTHV